MGTERTNKRSACTNCAAESEVVGDTSASTPKRLAAIDSEKCDNPFVKSIPKCGKKLYVKGMNSANSKIHVPITVCVNDFKIALIGD